MKYFLDTEFIEGPQKKLFGTMKPTIDLISIALVDETGREYYAISKEFNLKEAWNRYEKVPCCKMPEMCGSKQQGHCEGFKRVYWLRDNVLRKIYDELLEKEIHAKTHYPNLVTPFNYKSMKNLIGWHGKTKVDIANDIAGFIYGHDCGGSGESAIEMAMKYEVTDKNLHPEFYAYYAGYDWVAFCWIFGSMMALPKGFPKYCNDLKQSLDETAKLINYSAKGDGDRTMNFENRLEWIKNMSNYPKQQNEHHALSDAKWDKELFDFLQGLQKIFN
jgi:hypothetical protein